MSTLSEVFLCLDTYSLDKQMSESFKREFGVRVRSEWLSSVLKIPETRYRRSLICPGIGRKPPSARTTSTSSRNSSIDLHVLPKELEEKVATLPFPALGEVLTVLAREHAEYTGVKVEGPTKGEHHRY